jgi:hypothetical protein
MSSNTSIMILSVVTTIVAVTAVAGIVRDNNQAKALKALDVNVRSLQREQALGEGV